MKEEQEFLHSCSEFVAAKRLSHEPETLRPFRAHIPGGFSSPTWTKSSFDLRRSVWIVNRVYQLLEVTGLSLHTAYKHLIHL